MASYHRTQILLEGWQHAALKSLADREGVSVSDLVRRILSRRLRPRPPGRNRLAVIAGIGRDRRATGRDHDRWLYGPGGEK
jgi:predicted DNA-binding ribbon-helix-helix protein